MPHLCPWWGGYFIDNAIRRLLHKPEKIVGPCVKPGMIVMDVGCGMGMFSIAMAKMVGDQGRVIAIDLQQKMLDVLWRRAERAGVADRIQLHKCEQDRLGIDAQADFALALTMIHEVPDQRRLLGEIQACLKPGGKLLVAEPKIHVPRKAFGQTVAAATELGFKPTGEPRVHGCRAVVFDKVAP
jgi:ubiquinone/menaquinone biosynthesis C-methylase UbiE